MSSGREVRISAELNGHNDNSTSGCEDGNDEDAILQIDDIYFADEFGNEINPGFNSTRIMEFIDADGTNGVFGLPIVYEGLSLVKLNDTMGVSIDELIEMWDLPPDIELQLRIINSS